MWGASPDPSSLGHALWMHLRQSPWAERVVCINPKYTHIEGLPCLPNLESVTGYVTLALVAAPLAQLPTIRQACLQHRIHAAVLYGAQSSEGAACAPAHDGGPWRVWGPRALGYALPHRHFNALALHKAVPKGHLGFVSHSNAIAASVLDWQHNDEFGFSAIFCPGQASDIDVPDLVDYLATDIHTETILLYLESVRDARRFLSAVRAAASVKPVIVVKAARQGYPASLGARHPDLVLGDDAVFDAALRRCGALRVGSVGEMFSAARALGNARKPRGGRLAIVSNGGGPLLMATDALADQPISLAPVGAHTLARLQADVPLTAHAGNPVDVLFDADTDRYAGAVQALLDDPAVDGVLTILTPNTFVDPMAVAQRTIEVTRSSAKPVLSCWMGEIDVRPARARFAAERMASFRTPEAAVAGFAFLVNWVRNQAQLQETPAAVNAYTPPDLASARNLIAAALPDAPAPLDDQTLQALLAAFHIRVRLGGGNEAPTVAWAVTLHRDPVFGTVMALHPPIGAPHYALPPLNRRLTAQLCAALGGVPGTSELEALQELVLRVSEMAAELPWLQTLRLEWATLAEGTVHRAMARVAPAAAPTMQYRHMAICPYPQQGRQDIVLRNGTPVCIRPIWPEDATALQDFVRGLSARSKYYRFFNAMNELPPKTLVRYTQIDYAREMTLVALVDDPGQTRMVGEANYSRLPDGETCEFALVVADGMAGQGLGAALMRALMDTARAYGLRFIEGEVLANNQSMRALMESLGFDTQYTDEETVRVARSL